MGNKDPWKTGMLMYLPVTSRPLIFLQKEAILSEGTNWGGRGNYFLEREELGHSGVRIHPSFS